MDLLTVLALVIVSIVVFKLYLVITCGRYKVTTDLTGKTILVTGGTAGIGLETVRELAAAGARVFIVCRDTKKGQNVANEISKETGNSQIFVRECDLCNLNSVRQFAKSFLTTDERIDVLINNAGASGPMSAKPKLTADGMETTMQANHFGHFLLTNLLLDRIKQSPHARIINVSSMMHQFAYTFDVDYPNCERSSARLQYSNAKLANILFTTALAKRLKGTDVTVNALHPGAVATKFGSETGSRLVSNEGFLKGLFMKTPKEGAMTTLMLAVEPTLKNVTGKYFADCKEMAPSSKAQDAELAEKFWKISAKLVGLV